MNSFDLSFDARIGAYSLNRIKNCKFLGGIKIWVFGSVSEKKSYCDTIKNIVMVWAGFIDDLKRRGS